MLTRLMELLRSFVSLKRNICIQKRQSLGSQLGHVTCPGAFWTPRWSSWNAAGGKDFPFDLATIAVVHLLAQVLPLSPPLHSECSSSSIAI